MNKAKNALLKQKKIYLFIITLIIIGFITGVLFWFVIGKDNKELVANQLSNFFEAIKKKDNLNFTSSLINSLITNISYVVIIWLLGISIIGIPIVIFLLLGKSFIVGFSISSIIGVYQVKGILGALCYTFPHQFIFLLLLLLLSFYSLSFSIKLFKYLFLRQIINFKDAMRKYMKILVICLGIAIVVSLLEIFLGTYIIGLFTLLI